MWFETRFSGGGFYCCSRADDLFLAPEGGGSAFLGFQEVEFKMPVPWSVIYPISSSYYIISMYFMDVHRLVWVFAWPVLHGRSVSSPVQATSALDAEAEGAVQARWRPVWGLKHMATGDADR